jgi:hypothetical protein
VDQQIIVTAMKELSTTLSTMALVLTLAEDPIAIPEPPASEEVSAYAAKITAVKENVSATYYPLLDASLRDYQAGYPDRAGAYLTEFLGKLVEEPTYSQNFSPASQNQLRGCVMELREV